jgi:hypothetical protein
VNVLVADEIAVASNSVPSSCDCLITWLLIALLTHLLGRNVSSVSIFYFLLVCIYQVMACFSSVSLMMSRRLN